MQFIPDKTNNVTIPEGLIQRGISDRLNSFTSINGEPPGLLKVCRARLMKGLNFHGKRVAGPSTPGGGDGEEFLASCGSAKMLLGEGLATVTGGGHVDVERWPDEYHARTAWAYQAHMKATDVWVKCEALNSEGRPNQLDPRMRLYLGELMFFGTAWRYMDAGSFPPSCRIKALIPNPKKARTDIEVAMEQHVRQEIIKASNRERQVVPDPDRKSFVGNL